MWFFKWENNRGRDNGEREKSFHPIGIWHSLTGWHSVSESGMPFSLSAGKRCFKNLLGLKWILLPLPSPLTPYPIVFCFDPGSAFVQKKTHRKKLPATQTKQINAMFVLEHVPSFRVFNRCSVSSRYFSVCSLLCTTRSAVICNSRNSLSRFATSSALCRKTRKYIWSIGVSNPEWTVV